MLSNLVQNIAKKTAALQKNDKFHTHYNVYFYLLKKWRKWYGGYDLLPQTPEEDESAFPDDLNDLSGASPARRVFVWLMAPLLQKKGDVDDLQAIRRYKRGTLILLPVVFFIVAVVSIADFVVSLFVDTLTALTVLFGFGFYLNWSSENHKTFEQFIKTNEMVARIVSFMNYLKNLLSIYVLIKPLKGLAIFLFVKFPSLGLELNRPAFMLGAFAMTLILLGVVVGSGGVLSPFLFVVTLGHGSAVVASVSALCSGANAAFGVAGTWMALHWFGGWTALAFTAVAIKWTLLSTMASTMISFVGNVTAAVFECFSVGIQKGTGERLYSFIETKNFFDDGADKFIDSYLDGPINEAMRKKQISVRTFNAVLEQKLVSPPETRSRRVDVPHKADENFGNVHCEDDISDRWLGPGLGAAPEESPALPNREIKHS